jgi:hypothetical protein
MHAQAASICLKQHGHSTGVELTIQGDFSEKVRVQWVHEVDGAMARYWNDLTEAVEQGAVGLAMLIARLLSGYTVIERSVKGTGVDWWLGSTDDPLFTRKARLEVSGILSGTAAQVDARMRLKIEQSKQSDTTGLGAYIVVVEFSAPQSQVVKR